MPQIKKKGTSGQAKNFITRTQAVRKLQVSLPDFRRLCIFKGIYPREPRNKKKASKSSTPSTTFYYTKDISYLLHEPLLRKFREHKTLSKKITRALGRGEVSDAARLERTSKPRLPLDHIIKERYPTFVDALRDLDDALSMLFLFANLPSTTTVPPKTIALCQRLCLEFQQYLIVTNSLRKSFLSIKGIYYQATIQGQDILWLVPYKFVQRVVGDVDFRIMGTFVEFYTTLLGFVNFRLYTSVGLIYPPTFNARSDDRGAELSAFTLEGKGVDAITAQPSTETKELASGHSEQRGGEESASLKEDLDAVVQQIAATEQDQALPNEDEPSNDDEKVNEAIDTFEAPISADADILAQPSFSPSMAATLFSDCTFFLSRETPRQPLEFLLRSFGCKRIGWDAVLGDGAFTSNEADTLITHQIVDRPSLPQGSLPEPTTDVENESKVILSVGPPTRVPGRTYVQPQWVWDCVNEGKLLRPDLYAPGADLPPHLSPWVKPSKGEYDPTAPLAEQEREGEAAVAEEEDEEEQSDNSEVDEAVSKNGANSQNASSPLFSDEEDVHDNGMTVANSSSSASPSAADPSEWSGIAPASPTAASDVDSDGDADRAPDAHQLELEAEAAGLPVPLAAQPEVANGKTKQATTAAKKKRKEEREELERQMMMMSRRKRKTLEKMLYSNAKKEGEAEKLRSKRRKIEKESG
ncbi:MAG: mRNA-binding ribosome synthesis protein nop7 [Piccolia ochrophora]|nr:MAG: mRNA-binding ribosome synthesis protein nop7 [Piccolia ochrophora]